jgi:hypothetical protein
MKSLKLKNFSDREKITTFIPERFTLVKMEGYAVVMGPKLFIVPPRVPAVL